MMTLRQVFLKLGKVPLVNDNADTYVELKNSDRKSFDCVIKHVITNDICKMYKIIFTDFVKMNDMKIVYDDLERYNKNVPIGHFYYEPESQEIRFIINVYLGYDDDESDAYLAKILEYGMCIYGEYYMTDYRIEKYSNIEDHSIDDDTSVKYFLNNVATIEKIYKTQTTYSKNTILALLNSLNMKANLAEAILRDNQIVIRVSIYRNSNYAVECMDHINEHLKMISGILK